MNAQVFLAVPGNGGIERAERTSAGAWETKRVAADQDVSCLALDPHDDEVAYAGTNGNGLLKSVDKGRSWRPAGLEGQTVKAVAVSPVTAGLVYAGTRPAYMFVSRDSTASWQELPAFRQIPGRWFWFSPAESPWKAYVQGIAPSPVDPERLVVGIEFGAVIRSDDGGQSWSRHLDGTVRDCHSVKFHHSDGGWVYESGGSGGGVSFSRDGGLTWSKRKSGLDRNYGWACAADPERPEIWYASLAPGPGKAHADGTAEAYVYRADGGAPWVRLEGGLPQPLTSMAYGLITDPAAPGHLYAGLGAGQIWHTADYGDTWSQLPVSLSGIHRSLVMWTSDSQT
jgi:hypothetical protein